MKKIILLVLIGVILTSCVKETNSNPNTVSIPCRTFQLDNGYVYQNMDLNLSKTAIILIDLWPMEYLDELIEHKINPLLELAHKKDITVIHAFCNWTTNHLLNISPEDIVMGDCRDDGCMNDDKKLKGIDTLLYAGYDSLLCVLDKPYGMLHIGMRNKSFKKILIRDGVMSKTKETNQVAINLIETNIGCSITIEDIYNAFNESIPEKIYHNITFPENSSFILSNKTNFNLNSTIVIVNYFSKTKINNIDILLEQARINNLTVVFIEKEIPKEYNLYPNEHIITSEQQFMDFLKRENTEKLFYAGRYLNGDMMFGFAGISRLYIKKTRAYAKTQELIDIPDYYVISDLSLVSENAEELLNQTFKKTLLTYYRDIQSVKSKWY